MTKRKARDRVGQVVSGCIKCKDLKECCCTLTPNENSGKGRPLEREHDTLRKTQYPLAYRLARGFRILSGDVE